MGEVETDTNSTNRRKIRERQISIKAYTSEDAFTLVIPKDMIIRESPSPRKGDGSSANWPPQSSREALLISPSGRKRLQTATNRDTSPSPSKRRRLADPTTADEHENDDDDDDEETVKLKLQAIEARLKLKRLQRAKNKTSDTSDPDRDAVRKKRDLKHVNAAEQAGVEVPLSPKPHRANIQPPQSPRRVQLGIDKGLRAEEVSLKKSKVEASRSKGISHASHDAIRNHHKSFSARLAQSRTEDIDRQKKQERRQKHRSDGFSISQAISSKEPQNVNPTSMKQKATSEELDKEASARDDRGTLRTKSGRGEEGATSPSRKKNQEIVSDDSEPFSGFKLSKRKVAHSALKDEFNNKALISIPKLLKTVTAPNYDPPDVEDDFVIFGIIASKSLPHSHIPKHQSKSSGDPDDVTVLPPRSKFMAIRLTDLKWEVDLFLFDTAFEKFWKLTVGTVIAILNPGIMPPKPHMRDSGQFSLKVSSSEDTLLEIGMSEDLGFCKSVKKDGKICGQWIDGRKTEFCDFHVNLRVEKAKAERMEINGMANLGVFGSHGRGGSRRSGKSGGSGGGRGGQSSSQGRGNGLTKEGAYFDHAAGATAYSIPKEFGGGINTSRMLDAEDYVQGGLSKAERSRRRLAEREKELGLAKALGSQGSGMGSEYMRLKQGSRDSGSKSNENGTGDEEELGDAASLGLIGNSAQAIKLSPSHTGKKRHGHGVVAEPMGWGNAFRRGLPSPSKKPKPEAKLAKDMVAMVAEKPPRKEMSPSKQARFLLEEKGIRIPGRESNGATFAGDDDDDDDGLDIV